METMLTFPFGLQILRVVSISQGTYNNSTGVWTIVNLAPDKTTTLTMIVKAEKGVQFINTAILSGADVENITDSLTVIVKKANNTNHTNHTNKTNNTNHTSNGKLFQ